MEEFINWGLDLLRVYGWKVFWILALLFGGRWVINFLAEKIANLKEKHLQRHPGGNLAKRAGTIEIGVVLVSKVILYGIIFLMVLDLFQVKIGPLMAGLGIAGLAIGLGAQRFLQSLIAGLFFIIEDSFDVGDEVEIRNHRGKVIKMSLTSVIIQGEKGEIIYFPNGEIKEIINFSQKKSHFSSRKKTSS